MRLLLVNPEFDSDLTSYGSIARLDFIDKRAFIAPLPLATLAAQTPDEYEVTIWDEALHGRIDESDDVPEADLIGVTGYISHVHRAREIGAFARGLGVMAVAGGPGVSSSPAAWADCFDVLFVGETEHTWRQFLNDWKRGSPQREYRQIVKPDLADSPLPRWDSIAADLRYYFSGAVQTTRGCPFDCEFCDVIFLYGRQPRHKPVGRVLEEVAVLERLGVENIFFCDDNFIGNPKYTRQLLPELVALNRSFKRPLSFTTQITLNVARHEDVLELLAAARFSTLYIGIESPNKESLKETNKPQNYRTDIIEDVRTIQSHGLPVRAGMVVGFDHDDVSIFDEQFEFLQAAAIPVATVNMLKAPLGTKLWSRLLGERRVIAVDDGIARHVEDMTYADTNIVPKQMTREELMHGFIGLLERINSWPSFAARVKAFVSMVRHRPGGAPGARDPAFLRHLLRAVDDPAAARTILDIVEHTRRDAPFILNTVVTLILQFIGVASMARALSSQVGVQIERELACGGMDDRIDRRPVPVPEAFRQDYNRLFPPVAERLMSSLSDHKRLPQSLVEVFTDFLFRWGDHYDAAHDHRAALMEIADRTAAARNASAATDAAPSPGETVASRTDLRLLSVEVLKCVERDLRKHSAPPAHERADATSV